MMKEQASNNSLVILHSYNRQLEFYSKMKDVEKLLDEMFYRCHNSYIVNKDKIKKIDIKKRIAFMNNDEECFISTVKPYPRSFNKY